MNNEIDIHIDKNFVDDVKTIINKGRSLAYFRKFYLTIPNISILQTRLQNLRCSHIIEILRVNDEVARRWYLETASCIYQQRSSYEKKLNVKRIYITYNIV